MAYMQMYIHSLSTSMCIHGRLSLARGTTHPILRNPYILHPTGYRHIGGMKPPDWAI